MMKKLISLLLLVCLLCGCTPVADPKPTTQPSVAPTTAATVPTTQLPEDIYVEEPVQLETITKHGFYKTNETPTVAVLDARAVALVGKEYHKDTASVYTRIRLIDPYTGYLRTELELEGGFVAMPHTHLEGLVAIASEEGNQILVLDKSLRQVLSFQPRATTGVLSRDLASYYYLWGGSLYRMDIATGQDSACDAGQELPLNQICDYDPQENILLVSAFENMYTMALCMAAVDLDDGSFKLLYGNTTTGDMTSGGAFLVHNNQEGGSDAIFGNWDGETMKQLPNFLANDAYYSTWHIAGSDYIFQLCYDKQMVNIQDCRLYRLGQTVEVCSLQPYLKGAKTNYTYLLPDGNLLLIAMSGRGYTTYLLCPAQLEFVDAQLELADGGMRTDTTILENYDNEPSTELSEKLAGVRQMADRLEDTYDITILLSNECHPAIAYSGLPITTTDQAGLVNEEANIRYALQQLEEILKLYPEDFFTQFQNEAGERGLLVLLVEDIAMDNNVIGVSYTMGQWYPVAIDITSGQVRSTYCHEIWHATENRINDLDINALDLEAWNKVNPADFHYAGVTPDYYQDTRYTFFYGTPGEPVYFVDPYAKTLGQEDRARLMEYLMTDQSAASQMMKHPALYTKMELLCQAIRNAFQTEEWEDVYWERFLRTD